MLIPISKKKTKHGYRPRAIVKELVLGDSGVDSENAQQVLSSIEALNKAKIYIEDFRSTNFINGRLYNFSMSRTEPHELLAATHDWKLPHIHVGDLVKFDAMIEREGVNTTVRALRNVKYCKKLRSSNRRP